MREALPRVGVEERLDGAVARQTRGREVRVDEPAVRVLDRDAVGGAGRHERERLRGVGDFQAVHATGAAGGGGVQHSASTEKGVW